jgi:MarR family transcriptional regulator, repressor for mepA
MRDELCRPWNDDLGYWLKQLGNVMEQSRNKRVAPMELTSSQMEVILFLAVNKDEEVNQIDVEKYMHCSNPTVTGIVKRLEAKEFIVRLPSKRDKRYKRLVLTDKALKLLEEGNAERIREESKLLQGFSEEEQKAALSYVKRMIDNLLNS